MGGHGFSSAEGTLQGAPRSSGRTGLPRRPPAPRPRPAPGPAPSRRPPGRPARPRPGARAPLHSPLRLRSPRARAEPDKWYAMTRGMITLLLLVIIRVSAI